MRKTKLTLFCLVMCVVCAVVAMTFTACGPEEEVTHTHTYADEWSKDGTNHWHASTCGHDVKSELGEHTWNDGEVTTEATHTTDGVKTFTCTVCSATREEEIPAKTNDHTYADEWSKDEANHWHASTCGHDVKSELGEHTWNDGVVTTKATFTSTGVMTYTCTTCAATREEEIPVVPYTPTIVAGTNVYYANKYVKLEQQAEGDFSGAYKYSNYTSGTVEGTQKNWGESGLFFEEVFHHDTGGSNTTFTAMGRVCIKLDIYIEYATSLNLRLEDNTTVIPLDTTTKLPSSYMIVAGNGNKVDKISAGVWYTLYITPGKDCRVNVYMNGGSAETPSVMYFKNASYEKETPFFPTLGRHTSYTSQVSIDYQTSGEFEGAYKYVNGHGGRENADKKTYGETGVYFSEVWTGGTAKDSQQWEFFNKGYAYVKFDLYIDSSVKSIDFRRGDSAGSTAWNTVTIGSGSWNSDVWKFYGADGQRVTTLEAGQWYTVYLEAAQANTCIQANGVDSAMYFKNVEYLTTLSE